MSRLIIILFLFSAISASASNELYDRLEKAFSLVTIAPDSSIQIATDVLQKSKTINDPVLTGRSLIIMGQAYRVKGELELSTQLALQAIELLPDTREGKRAKSSAYGGLGNNFYTVGDLDRATDYCKRAFQLKLEVGTDWESAIVATQLVGLYSVTSQPDSAMFFANYAKPILESDSSYQFYLSGLYNSLGAHYQMTEQIDSAYIYYEKSVTINEKLGTIVQLPVGYFNMAEIARENGQIQKTLELLNPGLDYLQVYPNPEVEKAYYRLFSACYSDLGDLKRSLFYRDKQDSVQTTINQIQHQSKILELEAKYQDAARNQKLANQKILLQQNEIELSEQQELNYLIILLFTLLFAGGIILFLRLSYKRRFEKRLKEEKEKMFTNVIHEIRTPLSLITAPLDEMKKYPEKFEENYSIIERNSNRLINLVNQLLDVSRIDNLRFEKKQKVGVLLDFLDELVKSIDPLLSEKQLLLHTHFIDCDQTIQFDFDSLQKICSNLLTNAIKYSKEKGEIHFSVKLSDQGLFLEFKDEGVGIDAKSLPLIFDRFERAKNVENHPGIGIGLALTKQLVEIYEGQIEVESQLDLGAAFRVSFPFVLAQDTDENQEDMIADTTVLLLEDNADMRTFIHGVLQKSGYEVLKAENGQKGIEQLNERMPDLIVSDVMMPEMDGLEFAGYVKENELFSHIPFIFLSAKSSLSARLAGLKTGADLYLEKPFQAEELRLVVQNQINRLHKAKEQFHQQLGTKELSFTERIQSNDPYLEKVNEQIIEKLSDNEFSVELLAENLNISRSQLHRKLKSLTGYSISSYIRIVRLEKALDLLKSQSGNVTEIAYETGFSSQSYFTKSFAEHFGFPPSEVNQKASKNKKSL